MSRYLSEREAWLEVARMWVEKAPSRNWSATGLGLCRTVMRLYVYREIPFYVARDMQSRLHAMLGNALMLAPAGREREARAMLALLFAAGADPR